MPKRKIARRTKTKKVADDSFEAVARRLECDEDPEKFEKTLSDLVRPKRRAIGVLRTGSGGNMVVEGNPRPKSKK